MTAPPVSVVLPVYNGARYLDDAIRSIREQSCIDFEFLIIENGSTDGSPEIIERHAQEDVRIRVRSLAKPGLVAALNEGLALARGEYVARIDADDVALPTRLEVQLGFMRQHPRCVLVGCSYLFIDEAGREIRPHHCFLHDMTIRHALPVEGCVAHPAAMFRRSAAIEAGGYQPNLDSAEDYDLWRRLAALGELRNVPQTLLHYREWGGRMSVQDADVQRGHADRIRDEIWNDEGLARDRRLSLRTLAELPGEPVPALVDLQRELARNALRRRDVGLFAYLCWDLMMFRLTSHRRRRPARRAEAPPAEGRDRTC